MKKFISLMLIMSLMCFVTACGKVDTESLDSDSSGILTEIESGLEDTVDGSTAASDENISGEVAVVIGEDGTVHTIEHPSTDNQNDEDESETPAIANPDAAKIEVEEVKYDDNVETEITSPEIEKEVEISTPHTQIPANSYYQYSTLSSSEKTVYNRIVSAIKNTENSVNMEGSGLNSGAVTALLNKVLADYPQFFWVSKHSSIISGESGIKSLIINYTDGSITDKTALENNKLVLKETANRNAIANQISTFNNSVQAIVNNIPTNVSVLEKEKILHDYLAQYLTYDSKTAQQPNNGYTLSRSFDAYGAVTNKTAVCEGYTKLFQYVCYCVGINANQVSGTGNGGGHMWNVVNINGNWYHMDLTWNDQAKLTSYSNFNITESVLSKTHSIDKSNGVSVPSCTSTEYAFYNTFAPNASNMNAAPTNIEGAIDMLSRSNDSYLIVYGQYSSSNVSKINSYLLKYFIDSNSVANQYIKSKGYNISIEPQYQYMSDYYYISIKR